MSGNKQILKTIDNIQLHCIGLMNALGELAAICAAKDETAIAAIVDLKKILAAGGGCKTVDADTPPESNPNPIRIRSESESEIHSPASPDIFADVVSYLNEKAGTTYKPSSKATQRHIRARLAEGFALDDFRKVIDGRCEKWRGDAKMAQYLRPETLFGTKFESYLNQPQTNSALAFTDIDDILGG